jgi:hypothetical protein
LGVFKKPSAGAVALGFLLFASLAFGFLAGACGSAPQGGPFIASEDSGASGTDATVPPGSGDGGTFLMLDAGPPNPTGDLTVSPANQVVNVTAGQPIPTLQFTALLNGSAVGASWAIDRGELGAIGAASGLLTPAGTLGGVANITATYGALSASAPVTIFLHVSQSGGNADAGADGGGVGGNGGVGGEGPGGDPGSTLSGVLAGTPTADPGLTWLYPYDKTVWPRGLLAPLLQWQVGAQGNYDAVYIHITEAAYEYKGYFGVPPNAPTPFQHHPILQDAWYQATYSNGGEPLTIALTFAHGGQAWGPITETWTIAQGTLKGTVYYNSYGTALVHNACCAMNGTDGGAPFGGATLAIQAGTPQNPTTSPVLVAGSDQGNPSDPTDTGCRVCHAVSANGASLLTQRAREISGSTTDLDYGASSLYELTTSNDDLLMPNNGGASVYSWPAIYPDGTFLFSNSWAHSYSIAEFQNVWMTANSGTPSTLYPIPPNTASFTTTNLPVDLQAACPAFSPDGAHLAFNFSAGTAAGLSADGVSLASLDLKVLPGGIADFSNFKELFTPGMLNGHQETAVWPSFLPATTGAASGADAGADGGAGTAAVAFELEVKTNGRDFAGTRSSCDLGTLLPDQTTVCTEPLTEVGSEGELWWVDLGTQTPYPLYALNGKNVSGNTVTSYLPTLAATDHTDDTTVNFEPTVNPVPSGGYAWVVFTSRRLYGNVATVNPYYSDPRFHDISTTPTTKKLWVAAIDLNAAPGTDPSHPAFYLPAQELLAGNSRGFWVVDPCQQDGTSCETGDQCCGGYCRANGDGGALVCSASTPSCANVSEKCTTTAQCCEAAQGISCIDGFCSVPTPK